MNHAVFGTEYISSKIVTQFYCKKVTFNKIKFKLNFYKMIYDVTKF